MIDSVTLLAVTVINICNTCQCAAATYYSDVTFAVQTF